MKKIVLSFLAVAALAACANEDVIGTHNQVAIQFGDAFVNNSTKVIYEGDTKVTSFELYGTVTGNNNTVALYEGVTMEGTAYSTVWTQTEGTTQYWLPSCTYDFYAIVDATKINATSGVPTTIEYTANGTTDLLYGTVTSTTGADAVPTSGVKDIDNEKVVAFTLNHLLSKISFKFTNEATSPYGYNVTNLKLAGAYASGTYTIAEKKWVGKDAMANPLTFATISSIAATGSVAAESYVIIPGTPELTISFTAEVLYNDKVVSNVPYTLTVNNQTFEKNTHYNFVVELPVPGLPIKFTIVTVGGFVDGNEVTVQ